MGCCSRIGGGSSSTLWPNFVESDGVVVGAILLFVSV